MILKYGSKGKEVQELQEFLCISTDGHFGKGVNKLIANLIFQKTFDDGNDVIN